MLSILLPVFNEEQAIDETITRIHASLSDSGEDFEVIVINDGSTDGTAKKLDTIALDHVTVHHRPKNHGYSASLKYGIRHSKGELIGIADADGTYPVEEFPRLLEEMRSKQADMVVGARLGKNAKIPLIRKPAKAIVNGLANFLTGEKIPDLNSGMRIFTRELAERFMHLYPQRFSFTITITLAAFTNDYEVAYLPISYAKRKGSSTMSAGLNGVGNFVSFISLIIRMITYFRPIRFFVWPSLILFLGGIALVTDTLIRQSNVSDSGVLLIVSGLQIGLFGLLAEAVVRNRPN